MGDIIRDDAAQWRQCCQAAFFELDPIKLLVRIAAARIAVLDRIEGRLSKPSHEEACALRSALGTLNILHELAEQDIGEQKKTVQTQYLDAGYARYHKRQSSGYRRI
jgi:hypothetical protein